MSQAIGLADFTVTYHRPAVNKREVWGKLVPYGEVWRAGANENTTLTATTRVHVRRQGDRGGDVRRARSSESGRVDVHPELGVEGLGELQLRREGGRRPRGVKPAAADFTERLAWSFDEPTGDGATLTLRWEKLKASVPIGVDTKAVTLAGIKEQLRGLPRFGWQGWNGAAAWCLRNKTNLDEAMTWADRSVSMHADVRRTCARRRAFSS